MRIERQGESPTARLGFLVDFLSSLLAPSPCVCMYAILCAVCPMGR